MDVDIDIHCRQVDGQRDKRMTRPSQGQRQEVHVSAAIHCTYSQLVHLRNPALQNVRPTLLRRIPRSQSNRMEISINISISINMCTLVVESYHESTQRE